MLHSRASPVPFQKSFQPLLECCVSHLHSQVAEAEVFDAVPAEHSCSRQQLFEPGCAFRTCFILVEREHEILHQLEQCEVFLDQPMTSGVNGASTDAHRREHHAIKLCLRDDQRLRVVRIPRAQQRSVVQRPSAQRSFIASPLSVLVLGAISIPQNFKLAETQLQQ